MCAYCDFWKGKKSAQNPDSAAMSYTKQWENNLWERFCSIPLLWLPSLRSLGEGKLCQYIYPSESLQHQGIKCLHLTFLTPIQLELGHLSQGSTALPSLDHCCSKHRHLHQVKLVQDNGVPNHTLQLNKSDRMNLGPDTSYSSESPWHNSQPKGTTFTPWSSNFSLILDVLYFANHGED